MTNHDQEEAVLVRFFPGIKIDTTLQVGRVVFWSFPSQNDDSLPTWAQERARKYAEFFKDNHGNPLAVLVCATVQEPDKSENSAALNQEISYAADILCYAEQTSFNGSSSVRIDHFESHPFVIPINATSNVVLVGGVGHRTMVVLGADFKYCLPPFMSQESLRIRQNEPLLDALGRSLERWRQAEAGDLQQADVTEDRRLLRAMGWYNQSGFRYSRHTIETLILHAATALEALLDLPHAGITAAFRNTVALLLGDNAELRRWCGNFYDVRSHIIHGDETPRLSYGASGQRPHLSHLDFSRAVFEQCMNTILVNRGRLPYDPLIINTIRHMNIDTRLISNQQRLQEITSMEAERVLSNEDATERFRGTLVHIDHYKTNSVTSETCEAAIEKIREIIIRMCENIESSEVSEATTSFVQRLRTEIEGDNITIDGLFGHINEIVDLDRRDEGGLAVSGLPLRVVVDGLRTLMGLKDAI